MSHFIRYAHNFFRRSQVPKGEGRACVCVYVAAAVVSVWVLTRILFAARESSHALNLHWGMRCIREGKEWSQRQNKQTKKASWDQMINQGRG